MYYPYIQTNCWFLIFREKIVLSRDRDTDTLDASDGQEAHFDSQNKVGWQQLTPNYSGDGDTLIP